MIPFNKPPLTGNELQYVSNAMNSNKISGDGHYSHLCQDWFENRFGCHKALLTPSCTHALEMAAILLNIQAGDEVIMPSYTFVSTANAFALRGAKIVFVDVNPITMNMNELLVEQAITDKTKVIVPVHYAGISCDMDVIMSLASKYNLFVVEDAAQAMMSTFKGKALGTIGHFGTYSFHETKNYTSGGEGGALLINESRFSDRAEIIREKGTNRSLFFRGMVDKYSWVDIGSSFLPCELQAAYLWGQLEKADEINQKRLAVWNDYRDGFSSLIKSNAIEVISIPTECEHNAHMFYIKAKNIEERSNIIDYLKVNDVMAVFHYIPLHSAIAGKKYGRFSGDDVWTTAESERLIRLPLFFNITQEEVDKVISLVNGFFLKSNNA
jgi:dTDP-4-amino-4,6-dideoxygalactose transaminase